MAKLRRDVKGGGVWLEKTNEDQRIGMGIRISRACRAGGGQTGFERMHSNSHSHPLFLIRLFLAAAGGAALLLACSSSSSSSTTDGGPSGPRTTLGCITAPGKCDCTLSGS